jgi:hypothetical protein
MLNPYAKTNDVDNKPTAKLNISDTAAMLRVYVKGNVVSADLSTKLNIADTANMLNPSKDK